MTFAARPRRPIRSFVRREGRITKAQERALTELWPRYGVDAGDAPLDFRALFGRAAPVHVEIGFGNGDVLAAMAARHPEYDYLGIEVHRPGIGALLRRLEAAGLGNARVMRADAKEVLARNIPDAALSAVNIFFPDPWPKKRHHKRRLIQPEFAELVRRKLQPGGMLHLATDWRDYAEQMLDVLSQTPGFENTAGAGAFAPRPSVRPPTRFEERGRRLGHEVYDLSFRRSQR
ncbi:MAG: tRNA (guanosine(46)-N7)-methyltransferase TrmB [Candidatus Muproteobacteria bacterium RIFCSPHIGHO2_02_FULL_65_16]|uniref:tRNA (guanine-N(7)-)-methyltransferase n=1 Tax=Candidatus Muproteobacteria bacterium RIFCSPHIGHO2_02_FULL_65_16 TaxID=1817766 RepID=A0A1F6U2T8_9PROT|nr:MAG: tRNA (guanosine(46)-N7)-methyltransferase TrmB [Candidatus Muproteobacteria bacterium RIFCSPHIGHO2_02_FULL_65_16]